jgi:hypothetical protein
MVQEGLRRRFTSYVNMRIHSRQWLIRWLFEYAVVWSAGPPIRTRQGIWLDRAVRIQI